MCLEALVVHDEILANPPAAFAKRPCDANALDSQAVAEGISPA